jgi:hypothetical protein
MKKMVFCVIPLIMVLMGCASSGTALAKTNNNSPGMDLDAAIRDAAVQMEAKIPAKTMIALVSVASPSTVFSTQVLTRLESAIVSSGKLIVVDRANLDKVREEQGFQLSGEVDDESAKSIGRLLGAGAIVTGSLADLGDVYSLTLKAINIETATVAVSYLADLAKSARIETLLASGGGGTRTAQTGGSAPSAAKPAAPAVSALPVQTDTTPAAPPPAPAYKIGDTGPAGGLIFYDKGNNSDGWRYLEASSQDAGTAEWGARGYDLSGTDTKVGAGKHNTDVIMYYMRNSGEIGKAAQVARQYTQGGYTDWFLPSKDELHLIYTNLRLKLLGDFSMDWYWASSQSNNSGAWCQQFSDGTQTSESSTALYYHPGRKDMTHSVRAIRQF